MATSCESRPMSKSHLLHKAARGVVIGAAAGQVMGKVTEVFYDKQSDRAREREEEIREAPSFMVAAKRMVSVVEEEPKEEHVNKLGTVLHTGLGLGMGVLYSLTAERYPKIRAGRGLAFGLGFFLVIDEGMNTAFGWTPRPDKFPWQAHARGLVAHLVYGLVVDAALTACQDGARTRQTEE